MSDTPPNSESGRPKYRKISKATAKYLLEYIEWKEADAKAEVDRNYSYLDPSQQEDRACFIVLSYLKGLLEANVERMT